MWGQVHIHIVVHLRVSKSRFIRKFGTKLPGQRRREYQVHIAPVQIEIRSRFQIPVITLHSSLVSEIGHSQSRFHLSLVVKKITMTYTARAHVLARV